MQYADAKELSFARLEVDADLSILSDGLTKSGRTRGNNLFYLEQSIAAARVDILKREGDLAGAKLCIRI